MSPRKHWLSNDEIAFFQGALCALKVVVTNEGEGSGLYNEIVGTFGVRDLIAAAKYEDAEMLPALREYEKKLHEPRPRSASKAGAR